VTFLYKFKLGKIVVEIGENINLAFEEGYVNAKILQRWCAKFKIGDFSLKLRGGPNKAVDDRRILNFATSSPVHISSIDYYLFKHLNNFCTTSVTCH
ncbi:hypothetical protein WH47_05371, partial [Habropoda laboriosa]